MARKKRTGPKRKLSAYNRHVQREMKAGRSMKQAAASWKSGRRSSSRTPKRSTSRRISVRRSAPKKKVRKVGKSGFNSQKIMKYIRLAAMGSPVIAGVAKYGMTMDAGKYAMRGFTGVDLNTGEFSLQELIKGWTPFVAATAVTYGVPKLAGLIRGL